MSVVVKAILMERLQNAMITKGAAEEMLDICTLVEDKEMLFI